MKKLIVIADWASDSLTCQEVRSAVEGFVLDPNGVNISFVASEPSTIHSSYLLAQTIQIEERYGRALETVIFVNTDPRLQTETGVQESKGAEFIVMRLRTGIYVCGPNAGYDFSLIKEKLEETYLYTNLDKGSQFRSRDLYSRICAELMDAKEDEMDLEETSSNIIPELQGYYIGHIDNYGNVKTTITAEDFKGKYNHGDEILITIGNITKKVTYTSNLFGANPGKLVIYPGSSGKKDNPYLEIAVWTHFEKQMHKSGKEEFGNPMCGTKIEIK